ncbi:uncharacterized protein LOC132722792 [Ruditapes philippinarum]|uniref:uncharacterized protein LOC132722792 n=1 Tax=Ruditapes philippinarum TaxID=129788 RepID=UPI00295B7038|nr:uncharacterized protein LOC132722792 [Ruditapes philippinarum]
MSLKDRREAFVTLATNDTYSLGCLVLGNSLKRVRTTRQLVVMITEGVSNSMRSQLAQVFDVIQEVNVLDSNDPINLSLLGRPDLNVTFTKLHCWRLTQFDKAVFLDADTLVLQNVDELFDREELSAAPDAGWPDCFNSGVFVFKPSLETYESLLQFATSQGSFDGGDQGLLNMYFNKWSTEDISKHLPFIYNVVSQAFYSYLPAFTQFKERVKIVHFIGAVKPWHHTFDTNTRTVTPLPGTGHSQEFLQVWWNIFMDLVQPTLDPTLRKEKQLLPTIVVSHPCTQKTYVFVPKSGKYLSQVKNEAPWFWTKSPWQSLLDSPMQFCKMAFHALARCWKNKPNQIYQVYNSSEYIEMGQGTVPEIILINPNWGHKIDRNNSENTENNGEDNITEITVIPRSYSELESHYAEEPISHINPANPPPVTYSAPWITEGWEKGTKKPDPNPPGYTIAHHKSGESKPEALNTNSERESNDISINEAKENEISSPTSIVEDTSVSHSYICLYFELFLLQSQNLLDIFAGQIDYLGQDSFENIQRKIDETLNNTDKGTAQVGIGLPFETKLETKPAVTSPQSVQKVESTPTSQPKKQAALPKKPEAQPK